ncbi:SnoaL-like domain protein [Aquisphaera giovannonii]|uniref:SnoaL-like domain protein n=1 Tax=Aquisphaera giovannonii TaxID=406548 RepID=A0A5B9WCP0_9BACT|nr:nuclear transport factor 2 family protein [Aquisphaera giovannonii]QEH38438.1 SnoaL-like domain protein [Aquisphaera giovannonii]
MRAIPLSLAAIGLAGIAAVAASPRAGEAQPPAQPAPPAARQATNPASPEAPTQPAAAPAPAAPAAPAFTPEQKAVADALAAFVKAYNSGDTKALSAFFTEDLVLIDPENDETRGKAAVGEMYAAAFRDNAGLKLESRADEVRFITPDVARVEGESRISSANGDAADFNRFSAILVRKAGAWQAAEIREFAAAAEDVSPYDRLRDLEWMVGHWVDDGGDVRVEADVEWADNASFLVRTYHVQVGGEQASSGTMFIGWDPQSGQIKSWNFDSEGGHGEGYWTKTSDKEWVVKATGVLRDGRPSSATQIHTILNKDSVKTDSIDRIIGGQVAPDITDVVMVRKAPAPGEPAEAGAPAAAPTPARAATPAAPPRAPAAPAATPAPAAPR